MGDMSYKALYRAFRPEVWEDVKGQEHIVTTLRNQLKSARVGHAYLFQGTRGTGKTTVARIFARAVNCKNPSDGNPCNECESCKAELKGNSMSIIEMDAASNNGVDDARTLIEEVSYPPVNDPRKIYIIDEAHMLTVPAFNALLKTLEEPPEYALFILATTEMQKIPATILSRCQRYDFHRITTEVIGARLREVAKAQNIDIDERALTYVARVADGALRDGLSLLDQCASFYEGETLTLDRVLEVLGSVDTTVFAELFDDIIDGKVVDAIRLIDRVVEQGKELGQFVNDYIWYMRNLLLAQTIGNVPEVLDISSEQLEALMEQARSTDETTVLRLIRAFSELQAQMRYDAGKRTLLEIAIVRACRPSSERGTGDLEARISALEAQEDRMLRALDRVEKGVPYVPAQGQTVLPGTADPIRQEKAPLPKALPDDVREVVKKWDACVGAMKGLLRTLMTKEKDQPLLSVSPDGKLVMAFTNDQMASQVQDDYVMQELKAVIQEKTGKDMNVSVVCVADKEARDAQYPDIRAMFPDEIVVDEEEDDL